MAPISLVRHGAAIALAFGIAVGPIAASAQSSTNNPTQTARDAAATWVGFGAAQQLFGPPGTTTTAPSGVTAPGGATIAPADINGRMAPPSKPALDDVILRSPSPTVGTDADGRGTVVSGATIR
jgi:hypothetical protein